MATYEEMYDVIDDMTKNDNRWLLRLLVVTPKCPMHTIVADDFVRALIQAEDEGRYFNGGYGAHDEPCTYWMVGDDYIVTYLTEDVDFSAEMLTDAMLDDLIIERA